MQSLGIDLIEQVKKERMKILNSSLAQETPGSIVECPECHYISKNKRFTAMIFSDGERRTIKCFVCGIWRRLI